MELWKFRIIAKHTSMTLDSCSPWFPFHRGHQFDQLQQQEGETRLKYAN